MLDKIAQDAGWEENKHPRADNGQFGRGVGSPPDESDREEAKAKANAESHPNPAYIDRAKAKAENDNRKELQKAKTAALLEKHHDKFDRKPGTWKGVQSGEKIQASELDGIQEFDLDEVYSEGDDTPMSSFGNKGLPPVFIINHPNGDRSLVDTGGYDYARYVAPVTTPKDANHNPVN